MIPREVFEETLLHFFDPIRSLLDDPTVSDIMINGHDEVFIERAGRLHRTDCAFPSKEALEAARAAFAVFDVDGSGSLSTAELKEVSRE